LHAGMHSRAAAIQKGRECTRLMFVCETQVQYHGKLHTVILKEIPRCELG
jgi:hypothetical protein